MSERVTLDDVESKLRDLGGSATSAAAQATAPAIGAAAVGGVLAIAVVYLLGRRRGRREAPVLEIRRI
jgi:membrane protein DedA with SNARE-associated domain